MLDPHSTPLSLTLVPSPCGVPRVVERSLVSFCFKRASPSEALFAFALNARTRGGAGLAFGPHGLRSHVTWISHSGDPVIFFCRKGFSLKSTNSRKEPMPFFAMEKFTGCFWGWQFRGGKIGCCFRQLLLGWFGLAVWGFEPLVL